MIDIKQKEQTNKLKDIAHDYSESNARGSTFWMSLDDFTKYFYIMTLCFDNRNYK